MKVRLTAAVLALSTLPLNAALSAEPNTKLTLDLDRQPLEAALVELSKQGHLQLVIATGSLPARIAEPLHGNMSLGFALNRLLRDTGLTYKLVGDHTIAIVKSAEPRQESGPPTSPGASGVPSSDATNIGDRKVDQGAQGTNEDRGERSVNHRSVMLRLASLLGLCVSGAATYPACAADDSSSAQGQLEEVVVTAERRTSDVQKTAASISVRTGQELAEQGRYTLQDILRDVPSVDTPVLATASTLGGSDSSGGRVTIRGVAGNPGGGGSGGPISGSSTTAVYVDGVYEGLGGDHDLQRVEILRGPQGTLYGRSATSGVVATYTKDPTFDAVGGDVSAQLANYTQRRYTGALNVPLSDVFAIRASVSKDEADKGFYNAEAGAYDRLHGRVKALYKATDDLSLLFGIAFEENDANTGGCSGRSPALGTVVYDNCLEVKGAHNHSRQYWLNMQWNLGPVTLFYQPALRTYYQTSSAQLIVGILHMSQRLQTPHDQFVTQELRLASNDDGKLKWQTGFVQYWNNIHTENTNRVATSGALLFDSPTTRDVKNYGLFGEATYAFTDATRLTLGARYDYARVSTSQVYTFNQNFFGPENDATLIVNENTNPSGLRTWRKGNYKVRFEQDLAPQNLVYAMVSTGFAPGDVSVSSGGVQPYDAETLTAFEVGSKNRFLDDRLQLNGDVYYYDYGGFITSVNPDPNNPLSGFTTTVPARIWGIELETLYQLTSHDRLGLSYAFRDARYVDKPARFAAEIPWEEMGQTIGNSFTAPHIVNAYYEHVFNLPGDSTLLARIDSTWTSSYRYLNPTTTMLNSASVGPAILDYAYKDSGAVGNVNVNWSSAGGRFDVGAYVRNFADKRWISYDVSSLTPTRVVNASATAPRTYGVVLSAHF